MPMIAWWGPESINDLEYQHNPSTNMQTKNELTLREVDLATGLVLVPLVPAFAFVAGAFFVDLAAVVAALGFVEPVTV